jgi:hypothetical protein
MKYVVWCPDLGHTRFQGRSFDAVDGADAAEQWAEWHDRSSAEYRIVGGSPETVLVAPEDGMRALPISYRVTGEGVPVYHASKNEAAWASS